MNSILYPRGPEGEKNDLYFKYELSGMHSQMFWGSNLLSWGDCFHEELARCLKYCHQHCEVAWKTNHTNRLIIHHLKVRGGGRACKQPVCYALKVHPLSNNWIPKNALCFWHNATRDCNQLVNLFSWCTQRQEVRLPFGGQGICVPALDLTLI